MTAALIVLLCLSLFLLIYPYAIYPLLLKLAPRAADPAPSAPPPSASLLFCAYNEEKALPAKLANVAELRDRHPDLEILIYDDASSDETRAILEASDLPLNVISSTARRGKAHGMKLLAARATGGILVFTDANVDLAPDAIARLQHLHRAPQIGGVCGTLTYRGASHSVTASSGALYWRLDEALKGLETQTGNVMGGDGSIFSLRRELYPEFPDTVLDDLTVSMAAIFAGKRLIKCDQVRAYENAISDRREELKRKVRIATRALHTHEHLRPMLKKMSYLDRFKYLSHKYLRWFGGIFLLSTLASAAGLAVLLFPQGILFPTIAAGVVGTAFLLPPARRLAVVGCEVSLALFATAIGAARAMAGRTISTWEPAVSR